MIADDTQPQRFVLRASERRGLLTPAEATLAIDEGGLTVTFDGATRRQDFASLRGVRIQALFQGRGRPRESLLELRFRHGPPLFVYSAGSGSGGQRRHRAFAAFVDALHRAIPQDAAANIAYVRGVSEDHYRKGSTLLIVVLLLFGGGGLFVLVRMLAGAIPVLAGLGLIAAIIGFLAWLNQMRLTNRPAPYPPNRPPRDLYPE